MPVNGRPEMVARAVRSFEAQDYPNKHLLIYDSGAQPVNVEASGEVTVIHHLDSRLIGALRNEAIRRTDAEVIVHFDSDDWSDPRRISEQVVFLQNSYGSAVGYNAAIFCDLTKQPPAAWQYRHFSPSYALGESFCYWRKTWQRWPFPEDKVAEDSFWQQHGGGPVAMRPQDGMISGRPALLCGIHGRNTSAKISPNNDLPPKYRQWTRVPEWDAYCAQRFSG